jgi:hypothetical protein
MPTYEEDQAKVEALRKAIQSGEESGIAEGDVFEELRSYIRKVAAERRTLPESEFSRHE